MMSTAKLLVIFGVLCIVASLFIVPLIVVTIYPPSSLVGATPVIDVYNSIGPSLLFIGVGALVVALYLYLTRRKKQSSKK